MKNVIKTVTASVLVLGSVSAQATELDLDVTRLLSQTVDLFVSETAQELEASLKETLTFDAQTLFESSIEQQQSTTHSNDVAALAEKESREFVANKSNKGKSHE